MKENFPIEVFKSIIYDIESYTNRNWIVKKVLANKYPETFQLALVETSNQPKKLRIIISSSKAPIFGITDGDKTSLDQQYFEDGFISELEIEEALKTSMDNRKINYNILSPEVLNLSFSNKQELDEKLKLISIDKKEIELTLETINAKQLNYGLWYGKNLAFELFNFLDD